MKKLMFAALLLVSLCGYSQVSQVVRNGNNFSSITAAKVKTPEVQTKFTWTDSKGNVYPIYVGSSGACYVKRISQKTGKEYKYYLGVEISTQVCKELGIKYEPKKK